MVNAKKNPDFDLQRMRKKYLPLWVENDENRKKVDALFIRCFENDMTRFVQLLRDARDS